MKKNSLFSAKRFCLSFVAAAALLATVPALAAPPAAPSAGVPQPKILVIDRNAILQQSRVGQDIIRQVKQYTANAENDLKGESNALRSQGAQLQQQLAILSPAVKEKKVKDFQARESGLQKQADAKQSLIQGGFLKARTTVESALGPILKQIMIERGANLLLDRNAVVFSTVNVDITSAAVDRLNKSMPSLKVELVAMPVPLNGAGVGPRR